MNKATPFLFAKLMRLYSEFFIKTPTIEGLDNLTQIPLDQPLVIASTHLSDIDVQTIATNIAQYRDIGIASQSSNQRNIITGSFLRIAGNENIFGITDEHDPKTHRSRYIFNPQDFRIMADAMQIGKTIIIAAHKPTYDWRLPEKPGKGAVYLAQLTKAMILPIALNIKSNMPVGMADHKLDSIKRFILRKRPNAKITIGKPIRLPPINIEDVDKLKKQGKIIMESLQNMLPPEKQYLKEVQITN